MGLTKRFDKFTAVDKVTLSIKENEVFTILGHNGAGKTTMLFMLTGMLQPTSGDAVIYDHAVRSHIDEIRKDMGLCQQHDVLYEDLTAQDHLELVCRIKNLPDAQMKIQEILEITMLQEHRDKTPKTMSGGMKRKLSLAMALIGNSRTLILDEPTAGLDVESRRQVWDLILRIKESRSIIMSTQHIEEADYLSNRICVMSHGKVIAQDTPSNIKRRFGVGYNLFLEPINSNEMDAQQLEELADTVRQAALSGGVIEGIREATDSSDRRLIFQIPFSEVDRISTLVAHYENNFPELYVDVEMNSLEDAYLQIVEGVQLKRLETVHKFDLI